MSHAKPVDERAGHHALPAVVAAPGELVAPDPPDRVPADLRDRWRGFWTSPVAQVLDPVSDLEPVTRLFELYGLDAQMHAALNRQIEWLKDADADAPFDPQFARIRLSVAAEIRQLEQTLGVTPRGRLVIGAAVAAVGKQQQEREVHDDADD